MELPRIFGTEIQGSFSRGAIEIFMKGNLIVVIMAHNPLFHGTNEEYWDDFANTIYIPHYWTDSPLESMDHSANSVRN